LAREQVVESAAGVEMPQGRIRGRPTAVWADWAALAAYTAAIYAFLPYGPRFGLALVRTRFGSWLLGPGIGLGVAVATVGVLFVLWRRRAPRWAYAALTVAGLSYGLALSWLRAQHLERTHLPEYGIAAWLAWRAIVPSLPAALPSYAAAAALAAAIGLGDELLQGITPGRVCDIRDVAMNALGAVLGIVVIAAIRAERSPLSAGSSSRRSPRAAGS